jgi:hypothetical protein
MRDDARRVREAQQHEQQEQRRLSAERRNIDAAAMIHQQAYYSHLKTFVEGKATPVAAARSMQLLEPWHGVAVIELPDPPDEATARQALSMVAPGERHSAFSCLSCARRWNWATRGSPLFAASSAWLTGTPSSEARSLFSMRQASRARTRHGSNMQLAATCKCSRAACAKTNAG